MAPNPRRNNDFPEVVVNFRPVVFVHLRMRLAWKPPSYSLAAMDGPSMVNTFGHAYDPSTPARLWQGLTPCSGQSVYGLSQAEYTGGGLWR
jgi:hypothetical protein